MILVATPLPIEKKALAHALVKPGFVIRACGHGKVQFALGVQRAIQEIRPSLVVCAGGCGALTEELSVGEVVAATFTIEHDFKSGFGSSSPRELPKFPGDAAALARLSGVRLAAIASGDEDVLDRARALEIASLTGAIAVAWEGAGGARACKIVGVPFIEVRAVVDRCNAQTPTDFTQEIHLGMGSIARVLQSLAES